MARKGDVVFIENFRFSDGSTKDKLVVLLTDGDLIAPYLVVKTTSQSARFAKAKHGCNVSMKVFLILRSNPGFDLDTYIQLNEISEIPSLDMIAAHHAHSMRTLFSLPAQRFNELRNCLRLLKDDISFEHYRRLFP